MTRIKICGTTSPEDAIMAVESGADYIGIIAVPETPRCVSVQQARDICRATAGKAVTVLVFQNQPLCDILDWVEAVKPDRVQLHGQEPPNLCQAVTVPIIKTFFPVQGDSLTAIQTYCKTAGNQVEAILLDKPKTLTAENTVDKTVLFLKELNRHLDVPCFLAGGLTPQNIGGILAQVQPFAVDVASGVESAPGQKDPAKLQAFCEHVKAFSPTGGDNPCKV